MRFRGAACQFHRDRGLHGGAPRLPKNFAFTPNCFKEPSAILAPAPDPLFSSEHCTLQFRGAACRVSRDRDLHGSDTAATQEFQPTEPNNTRQLNTPLLSLINPPSSGGPICEADAAP